MENNKILELILNKVTTMESRFDKLEARFDKLEARFDNMEVDVKGIKQELKSVSEQTAILTEFREEVNNRFDRLENKLDDIEAQNAVRHIEITSSIGNLEKSINVMEAVTGKNMMDIAHIKAVKAI